MCISRPSSCRAAVSTKGLADYTSTDNVTAMSLLHPKLTVTVRLHEVCNLGCRDMRVICNTENSSNTTTQIRAAHCWGLRPHEGPRTSHRRNRVAKYPNDGAWAPPPPLPLLERWPRTKTVGMSQQS